jgi:hypothetical protein
MSTDKLVGATLTTEHRSWADRVRERLRAHPGSFRPRPVAAVRQLGPLGRPVRDRRKGGTDTRVPDDPETTAQASAHVEAFAGKSIGQVADPSAAIVGSLTEQPAIIGHSFGGLLTQILAGRGLASGISGHRPCAVPRRAAAAGLRAEVSVGGARQPGNSANRQPGVTDLRSLRYAFASTVIEVEAKVDTKDPGRSSLLFTSGEGEQDHTVPWAVTNAAFKRQQRNNGVTEIVAVPAAGTRSPPTAPGATSPAQRWRSCAPVVAMTHRPWVAK